MFVTSDGKLTIKPKPITISGQDEEIYVGDPEPDYTFIVDPNELVDPDTPDIFTCTASCPTYIDSEGEYPIIVEGDSEQYNYIITYEPGTLTILP